MSKIIAAFMVAFLLCAILAGIAEGGGGIYTTSLTTAVTDAATTLNVANTDGFLSSDVVTMGTEEIKYTAKTSTSFLNCTRGYNSTTAKQHVVNSKVYSSEASIINAALGFNVMSTGATAGQVNVIAIGFSFITKSVPRLVIWDFNFLKEPGMEYIRWLLIAISVGFVISLAVTLVSALGGLLQGAWLR